MSYSTEYDLSLKISAHKRWFLPAGYYLLAGQQVVSVVVVLPRRITTLTFCEKVVFFGQFWQLFHKTLMFIAVKNTGTAININVL
jgi:hypothetical protein